jgi:hypothetical protein
MLRLCLHQTTTNLYKYVPVFVIVMDFYSLVIGLMVKPLFAFTSDISFYILHIYRKHIQKPVKKLKIVAEISEEFYSKDVGKNAKW